MYQRQYFTAIQHDYIAATQRASESKANESLAGPLLLLLPPPPASKLEYKLLLGYIIYRTLQQPLH
jgi:hypothetical protein